MKAELVDGGMKTYVLVFEKGDEVAGALQDFAQGHDIADSTFTAIGAFSDATLGYFDRARKDYTRIPVREQVEVLSLLGNITRGEHGPKVHAHVVVGKADGTAHGGHLLEAHVWPTLEVTVTESPVHLRRKSDPETGLALIDLSATRDGGL